MCGCVWGAGGSGNHRLNFFKLHRRVLNGAAIVDWLVAPDGEGEAAPASSGVPGDASGCGGGGGGGGGGFSSRAAAVAVGRRLAAVGLLRAGAMAD